MMCFEKKQTVVKKSLQFIDSVAMNNTLSAVICEKGI
jgi:hypothetical protein